MTEVKRSPWWRHAVIYQIYVRSFADGNGDGIGDLPGICRRLPYLKDLGVDAVWLTPFYVSPMADGGYDVADHREVDPIFGTMADFDMLVERAHDLGLRLIVDLVPNHTSTAHPWFVEAIAAGPGSAARDRYIFRPGHRPGGGLPPNDWESVFGGPAWTRLTSADGSPDEWFLHLFAPEQADLNWENPQVAEEFTAILRFWLDRGVDGFRVDVAHGLVKDPLLPDVGQVERTNIVVIQPRPYFDQDGVHEIYREWRKVLESYGGERIAVAEAWVRGPQRLARYVRPDELHQAFNFDFLKASWDARQLRKAITMSLDATNAVGAPATWVLSNHDVVRCATRYGDGADGQCRARAAALLLLALPGSAYIYQGDELGLPEVVDLPNDLRQDPAWQRSGHTIRGRDGCRVPMPWAGDAAPFEFTTGAQRAWLPIPEDWRDRTVAAQLADEGSMLALYRTALRIRRRQPALGAGAMTWLPSPANTLAFRREPGFVCVVNLNGRPITYPALGGVLCASGPVELTDKDLVLPADTAAWLGTNSRRESRSPPR
jgi:alpha-glucosidase